jgi:hypothetical protein
MEKPVPEIQKGTETQMVAVTATGGSIMFHIRRPARLAALTAATAIAASGLGAYGLGVDTAAAEPNKGGGGPTTTCPDGQVAIGTYQHFAGFQLGWTMGIEGVIVPYYAPVYETKPVCVGMPKPPAPK